MAQVRFGMMKSSPRGAYLTRFVASRRRRAASPVPLAAGLIPMGAYAFAVVAQRVAAARTHPAIDQIVGAEVAVYVILGVLLALSARRTTGVQALGWQPVTIRWLVATPLIYAATACIQLVLGLLSSETLGGSAAPGCGTHVFERSVPVAAFLLSVILAPILEEAIFRGALYAALRSRLAFLPSAFISGTLFGLIHLSAVEFVPFSCIGVFYAWLRERSGSLIPSTIAHTASNAVGFAVILWGTSCQ
jgi:membrane protease YdiL (CAAX protease family)